MLGPPSVSGAAVSPVCSSFWFSVDNPWWADSAWACGPELWVRDWAEGTASLPSPGVALEEVRVPYVQIHDPEHVPTMFLHRCEVALAVGPGPALPWPALVLGSPAPLYLPGADQVLRQGAQMVKCDREKSMGLGVGAGSNPAPLGRPLTLGNDQPL